jgi:PAS domain S-box-containing protein
VSGPIEPQQLQTNAEANDGDMASFARVTRQAKILDTALTHINDFAYVFDRNGRFIYVNKPLLDLWGITLDEALGKNFFDLKYPDELAAKLQGQIQKVIEGKQSLVDETPYTSPAGQTGYYEYIFSPVIGADGSVEVVAGSTRVITARKNLELEQERLVAALENERARLAAIIEQAPAFICTLRGPEHQFEFANPRYYEIVGHRELIGKTVRDALPELEGQGFVELLDQVYRTGESYTGVETPVQLRRLQGQELETRFANFVYQALRDSDGSVTGVFVHGIDVTEIVNARQAAVSNEERLRTSEERLAFAVEAAELGSFYCPVPLGHIEWNDKCKEHFWLPHDAKVNFDTFYSILHPDDRERTRAAVEKAIFERTSYDTQYRTVSASGQVRWVRAKGRAYYGADGQPTRFDGVTLDVTEQKRVEAELLRSESRFRDMADTAPAILWVTESDGFCSFLSRGWYELTGQTEETGLGFGWTHASHPDDRDVAREAFVRANAERRPYAVDFRVRRADGQYRWVIDAGRPRFGTDGEFLGFIGSVFDITDRKQAEKEREHLLVREQSARADAVHASQMKDEFLATLSHELRTPLSAILGWSQILRRSTDKADVLSQGLDTIERNARVQAQIIEDLLDMSRIISGKVSLNAEFTNLSEIVHAAIDTVGAAASAKAIEVLFDVPATSKHPVLGDPSRLQQVFWNLLTNAIKFTPRGGVIQVRIEQSETQWQVRVIDTGEGINTEFLPYVFERFRQQDGSTTRRHGGLGLGLSIVKQLVELHGGTVGVSSEGSGRGATFTVALPIAVPTLKSHSKRTAGGDPGADGPVDSDPTAVHHGVAWDAPSCEDLAGIKVLVVDDEADARALLVQLFSDCNAITLVASSAHEAIELVESGRPDVLVSDIGMPEMDGYRLLRRVRELGADRGGAVPAIALTAYARAEDRVKAVRAGYQMHVPKPVEPAELIAMVASLVSRK